MLVQLARSPMLVQLARDANVRIGRSTDLLVVNPHLPLVV